MSKIKNNIISYSNEETIDRLQQELRNVYNRMNVPGIESNELGKLNIESKNIRNELSELSKAMMISVNKRTINI